MVRVVCLKLTSPSPSPSPKSKTQTTKGNGEFGLWAASWPTTLPYPPHPQLLSMKRSLKSKKVKNPGGQQEGAHGVVKHVKGEHYQKKGFKSLIPG